MTKPKISLVHCPKWDVRCPPYWAALLAGNLRSRGYEVSQKDCDIEMYHLVEADERKLWGMDVLNFWGGVASEEGNLNGFLKKYESVLDRFVDEILEEKPDIVGFSIRPGTRIFSRQLAKRLKAKATDVYIIFGSISAIHEHGPQDLPFVDALSVGEADESFPKFLEGYAVDGSWPQPTPGFTYRKRDGSVVECGPVEDIPALDGLPHADFSDYDFTRYLRAHTVPLMFSRGCVYKCSFCSAFGKYMRYRTIDVDVVAENVKRVLETTNAQRPLCVMATDQLLNGNLKQLLKLSQKLSMLSENIKWEGMLSLRAEMTYDYLATLCRSGLVSVFVGMESASEAVLKRMGKRTKVDESERIIKTFWEMGVLVHLSLVIGHPGETEAEFEKTYEFCQRIKKYVSGISASPLSLGDPDSGIVKNPEKYGVNLTHPIHWIADEGANTFSIRQERTQRIRNIVAETDWKAIHATTIENRKLFHPR